MLAAVSVALMATFTNLLATALTLAAIVYYDLVYTLWLKRTTTANTFWGGACGAAPVLIGWAAVTGSLAPAAWVLFAVVFFWQMPHFYAAGDEVQGRLCPGRHPDAAGGGLGPAGQRRDPDLRLAHRGASLALWPLGMSAIYGVPTAVVGTIFLVEAHRLCRRVTRGEPVKPMRLFHWSTTYLTIVFVAVALDALL